jgi:hypothetical protein
MPKVVLKEVWSGKKETTSLLQVCTIVFGVAAAVHSSQEQLESMAGEENLPDGKVVVVVGDETDTDVKNTTSPS